LARAWQALQKEQEETGQPHYTILRCRTDQPDLPFAQFATQLEAQLGKPLTEEAARKRVERSRRRFAELLVDEVARSLGTDQPGLVAEELIELGLMCYCRSAISGAERLA
jgi:hypothetical protein